MSPSKSLSADKTPVLRVFMNSLWLKDMVTEAENIEDYYCNTGTVHVREKGGNLYVDVTDELLTILFEDLQETYVFADPIGSYFWDFSATTGAKAQVRFVPKQ